MDIRFENKYVVVKRDDIDRYLNDEGKTALYKCLETIADSRRIEGKKDNIYLVLNSDEPYAGTVAQIMKDHGHYTPNGPITLTIPNAAYGIAEVIARNLVAWDTSKDKRQGLLPEVYITNRWLYKELTGEEYDFGRACKRFCIGDDWS